MRLDERRARARPIFAVAVALTFVLPASLVAETIDPTAVFPRVAREEHPSAEQILRGALKGWDGFSASIALDLERRGADGAVERSAFVLHRRTTDDARSVLVVSLEPASERGNRVLQISYGDGREETFVFVPTLRDEPLTARYRLAEPYLVQWHSVRDDDPPGEIRSLIDHEILGFAEARAGDERGYVLSLRSIVPRGYERAELWVAGSDLAVLERRDYAPGSAEASMVARVSRGDLVRFGDRMVPGRIVYEDRAENAVTEVRARYSPLPEPSAALFSPNTFHRTPLAVPD